ncbi:MAG: hypothetical protein N3A69_12490 [Leptospiraceae bacterium]|nr:hypothetical protein [Leptospiraceae bacterium]
MWPLNSIKNAIESKILYDKNKRILFSFYKEDFLEYFTKLFSRRTIVANTALIIAQLSASTMLILNPMIFILC